MTLLNKIPGAAIIGTTENGTTLCHNSPCGELWLVKECPYMAHRYFFTSYNLPCGELWHKIVPFFVVLAQLQKNSTIIVTTCHMASCEW